MEKLMLTEEEQKEILKLAKELASAYHKDKSLAKRIGFSFNGKTKAHQQAKNKLTNYLKEAGCKTFPTLLHGVTKTLPILPPTPIENYSNNTTESNNSKPTIKTRWITITN